MATAGFLSPRMREREKAIKLKSERTGRLFAEEEVGYQERFGRQPSVIPA